MTNLKLEYKLTEDEINESLLCMNYKREGILRDVNVAIVSILGVVSLVSYVKEPENFFWLLLLIGIILVLIYLVYVPVLHRKRTVKKILSQGGKYRLEIEEDLIKYGDENKQLFFKDEKVIVYESENVFVIKAGRDVFTIPLRILLKEEKEVLEEIVKKYMVKKVNVNMRKEKV